MLAFRRVLVDFSGFKMVSVLFFWGSEGSCIAWLSVSMFFGGIGFLSGFRVGVL